MPILPTMPNVVKSLACRQLTEAGWDARFALHLALATFRLPSPTPPHDAHALTGMDIREGWIKDWDRISSHT